MSKKDLTPNQRDVLETMEDKVTRLWQAVSKEASETKREVLRGQYKRAFRTLQIQQEILFS